PVRKRHEPLTGYTSPPATTAGATAGPTEPVSIGRPARRATGRQRCSNATRSGGSAGRLSEKSVIPPVTATREAQSSAAARVRGGRTTRQSGSFSHAARWKKLRNPAACAGAG